jgi:cytidyltransferase-like protein
MKKVVLVTGGFDPLHSGHIQYFKRAKELGDILYVGVNSDQWLTRKKGRPFMNFDERIKIIQELKMVDYTLKFCDEDGSARNAIKLVKDIHPNDIIIFANGGDRNSGNIPEMDLLTDFRYTNLKFEFGVGGNDKMNSSSWILEEWKAPKTERPWGYYRVLHEPNKKCKVKELTVMPGKHLSMQRHKLRNEVWFVAEGIATVYTIDPQTTDYEDMGKFVQNQTIHISEQMWHQLRNDNSEPLKIIEIQYGDACYEEDIERKEI